MSTAPTGHIELERTVESIMVGNRHRRDHGDLGPLMESISRYGLLQPITITLDGYLVCGDRRLAAIKNLGWKTVNVWVRSGVSDRLSQLLAEQDDNLLHKPLTQLEAAALYRELKSLLAEDAARRQETTQFRPADHSGNDGGANLAPPQNTAGKTRKQAARMVTGRASYTTLERIGRLEELASDDSQPDNVRRQAAIEVERIKAGGKVYPSHLRVNTELSLAELDQLAADQNQPAEVQAHARAEAMSVRNTERETKAAEIEALAHAALARVKATKTTDSMPSRRPLTAVESIEPVPYPLRVFLNTWDDLTEWWQHYDPETVARALTPEQWDRFEQTIAGTLAFAEAGRIARGFHKQQHRAS